MIMIPIFCVCEDLNVGAGTGTVGESYRPHSYIASSQQAKLKIKANEPFADTGYD
jgi:hypothetical protein